MKSFDLTFNGTVLPEYDPGQVKIGFAQLFRIEDSRELDQLFSGRTIVLRQNLDRKTAAEYFSRIAELGGKATLVESAESHGTDVADTTTVEKASARSAEADHIASIERPKVPRRLEPIFNSNDRLTPEAESALRQALSESRDELRRLRIQMTQMKEKSRHRYQTLQSRKEAFQRIAEQEMSIIEESSDETLAVVQSELETLEAEQAAIQAAANSDLSRLEEEKLDCRRLADTDIADIEQLKQESANAGSAMIAEVEQRWEGLRASTAEEIQRLEQLLFAARQKAEMQDSQRTSELEAVTAKTRQELASLDQKRLDVLDSAEKAIEAIQQREQEIRHNLETALADSMRRQQDCQHQCGIESSRLHSQRLEVTGRRDKAIAEVDQASAQLEEKTRESLKKLYALELQAKRRYNDALEKCHSRGLAETESPEEATAH